MKTSARLMVLLLAVLAVMAVANRPKMSANASTVGVAAWDLEKIKGVTFSARRKPDFKSLDTLASLGTSHIAVIPFAYQRGFKSDSVSFNPLTNWYTESDAGISELADEARSRGMGVILKPHIWVGRYSSAEGQTRDKIGYDNEEQWAKWERSYERYILHHAHLANAIEADVLVVGTELMSVATLREDFWRKLIADVRLIYPGKLTYAANWYQEYERVKFWDALDFIGVQAYFPISDAPNPNLERLTEGWSKHHPPLEKIATKYDKPILFTELGYRSVGYAAEKPWVWASREEQGVQEPDYKLQADLYDAYFSSSWEMPWMAGSVFWLWEWHGPPSNTRRRRRSKELDFTPQGKPAVEVMKRWFNEAE